MIYSDRYHRRMEIRIMRETDAQGAYSLMVSSLDEYYAPEVVQYFLMQWPSGQIVACDFSGRVIGYLAGARLGPGRASVSLFCVDPAYRSRGIGSMMLARFRQAAMMEGIGTIQLEVKENNASAIRFYTRNGFTVVERLERFYNDGSAGVRMISSGSSVRSN